MSVDNSLVSSLNAFSVEPSEQTITVSLSDLRQIITEAVQKAIEPLQDEVSDLRGIVAHQEEKIAALETTAALQEDNQLIQLRLINQLREETAREEPPAPEKSPLIDELYRHMRAVGLKQTTFAGASKILKRSKGRIKQLHPLLAMDQRFIILPSESHKQKLLIRLREFYEKV
jgi:hypothetical protein